MNRIVTGIVLSIFLLGGCKNREARYPVGDIQAETNAFWSAVPKQAVIERIGINFEFTEGPAWHPKGFLVFSDIPANTIYRWSGRKHEVYRSPSNQANGLWINQGGYLYACEHASRSLRRYSPAGDSVILAAYYQGKRLNSPNDLCRSSRGYIYFTDPPWGLEKLNDDPEKELPFNGVYLVKEEEVLLIDSTLSWPNGIALSPDERYLYVANTEISGFEGEEEIQAFWLRYTLDELGLPLKKEIFFRAPDSSLPGGPDGMKVDKDGNLFVTGPGGILVISPEAVHLGTIVLPIAATNLAFGPREKTLYITARSTVYRLNMD